MASWLLELPNDALAQVVSRLEDADAARCMASCSRLRQVCDAGWQERVQRRWRFWEPTAWDGTRRLRVGHAQPLTWPQIYAMRTETDRRLYHAFEREQAPSIQACSSACVTAALTTVRDAGLDCVDFLQAALRSSSSRVRDLAQYFMTHAGVNSVKQGMRELASQPCSDNEYVVQAAVLLGTLMFPQLPPTALHTYFDALAAEAARRMEAAAEQLGALNLSKRLNVISNLLFGLPPAAAPASPSRPLQPQQASSHAADIQRLQVGFSVESPTSGASPLSPFFSIQDASQLPDVPAAPYGLGLQGSVMDYYAVANSMLPQVLRTGQGIPISLCAIFLAVGHRCNLPLRMLGLPGHVMLEAGPPGAEELLCIDCFNGGRQLDRAALNEMFQSVVDLEEIRAAPAVSLAARMFNNVLFSAGGVTSAASRSLLSLAQAAFGEVLETLLHAHINTARSPPLGNVHQLRTMMSHAIQKRHMVLIQMGYILNA